RHPDRDREVIGLGADPHGRELLRVELDGESDHVPEAGDVDGALQALRQLEIHVEALQIVVLLAAAAEQRLRRIGLLACEGERVELRAGLTGLLGHVEEHVLRPEVLRFGARVQRDDERVPERVERIRLVEGNRERVHLGNVVSSGDGFGNRFAAASSSFESAESGTRRSIPSAIAAAWRAPSTSLFAISDSAWRMIFRIVARSSENTSWRSQARLSFASASRSDAGSFSSFWTASNSAIHHGAAIPSLLSRRASTTRRTASTSAVPSRIFAMRGR